LALISKQTGNTVTTTGYRGFTDFTTRLSPQPTTYWSAIEALCRQGKYRIEIPYNAKRGIVLVDGLPTKYPTVHTGPLRVVIKSAQRVYRKDHDYEDDKAEITNTFKLSLEMMWEDKFPLIAYKTIPTVQEAVTDRGTKLRSTADRDTWQVVKSDNSTKKVRVELNMWPPSIAAKELTTLTLGWELLALGKPHTLIVEDIDTLKTYHHNDLQLMVESTIYKDNNKWEITVVTSRGIALPKKKDVAYHENRFEFYDKHDRPMKQQEQQNLSISDLGTVKVKLTVAGTKDQRPHKLKLLYPSFRDKRTILIPFKNIPLPTFKPD